MNKSKRNLFSRVILLILAAAILLSATVSFSSCKKNTTKDDIIANVSESIENGSYSYVMQYLKLWGVPDFDTDKFSWVEMAFKENYNYGEGLPKTYEHARLTANYFIENFYDSTDLEDKNAVTDALIASYVNTVGDPYAIYRVSDEYSEYSDDINGSFGGIGVVVEYSYREETIMISSVNIGSPAEMSGLRPGDYIVAVDGVGVEEIGYLNAVYHIRGDIGTNVTVTVLRGTERLDFVCKRALVEEISVKHEMVGEYGYILVNGFKANTYSQFVDAIDAVTAAGAKGIVFDMRNNPGGLVSSVCDVISYLIPNGHTIISYDLKDDGNDVTLKSQNSHHPKTQVSGDHIVDLPFVVICNEYTASSAEIFTSAIRDYRNDRLVSATIVGTTTYKKGIMQSTFTYPDDSALTFTIAYYNPPSGENYHGIGITPDVYVENTATEDLQYTRAFTELEKLANAK